MASQSSQPLKTANGPVIALIGTGTIGLSFAALHLVARPGRPDARLVIFDPRPDLADYIETTLPTYFASIWPDACSVEALRATGRLAVAATVTEAVHSADIVQEQGPETTSFKQAIWAQIEAAAPGHALFWSSTSGIPASIQAAQMHNPRRLLVVHPFNPPHLMPLLEIVPASLPTPSSGDGDDNDNNDNDSLARTMDYWTALGRAPVVLRREVPGFVANRLAFALFREAADLVQRGVASPADIDRVVELSLGPRWAVRGPFWSYHAGGGGPDAGLRGFLDKIGATVQACWDDQTTALRLGSAAQHEPWEDALCSQVTAAYGRLGPAALADRDAKLKKVLDVTDPGPKQ